MSGVVTASLPLDPTPRAHPEADLRHTVMQYLDWALPADAVAQPIPIEGKRTVRARRDLSYSGYKAGWPDIQILWRGHPAILIELKAARGSLSADQRHMHNRLTYCGAKVALARSVAEVEALLRECGVPLRATVSKQQQQDERR